MRSAPVSHSAQGFAWLARRSSLSPIPVTAHRPSQSCSRARRYLAGAIANAACRQGLTVRFVRVSRFLKGFSAQHQVDRGFERELRALRRIDLLILDDWGIGQIDAINRSDLLEIIEDRCGVGSILVTTVLPVKAWARYIKDPTYSDSILDRLVRNAFRINMNGESMRGQTRYGAVPVEENTEN